MWHVLCFVWHQDGSQKVREVGEHAPYGRERDNAEVRKFLRLCRLSRCFFLLSDLFLVLLIFPSWLYRTYKNPHKTKCIKYKRLHNTLKRFGFNTILGIEEVELFFDSSIVQFTNPKSATLSPFPAEWVPLCMSCAPALFSFLTIVTSPAYACFLLCIL